VSNLSPGDGGKLEIDTGEPTEILTDYDDGLGNYYNGDTLIGTINYNTGIITLENKPLKSVINSMYYFFNTPEIVIDDIPNETVDGINNIFSFNIDY
jgi:hypothetical protein